jgi:hypothetical protein
LVLSRRGIIRGRCWYVCTGGLLLGLEQVFRILARSVDPFTIVASARRQWPPAVCSACVSKLGLPGLGAPAHPATSAVSDEPARIASKRRGLADSRISV